MKTLEIRKNSVKVESNGMVMLVAKYQDENGVYFLNENLDKQYAAIEEKNVDTESIKIESFMFYVSAWRGDQIKTYTKTVTANSIEDACEKIEKSYKRIYDYELA
jgi:penicillin-binding protein-related factor A (putative recombinase)